MKKATLVPIITISLFFIACKKEQFAPIQDVCELQTDNPAGRSYTTDAVIPVSISKKHCGIIPLSKNNYWVYQDSLFNNGSFIKVQLDTLRFTSTWESLTDKLIWWESNMSIGLPAKLYASDSAFFEIQDRMFTPGIIDARKEFGLFAGDSIKYITSFEDNAAFGKSVKLEGSCKFPSGTFDGCIYFEKNAPNFRLDQVIIKPGLGVLKYTLQKAVMGIRGVKLQQVSTLVAFHIE